MREFKGTKGEWHHVEYAGYVNIQKGSFYSDDNILDVEKVGNEAKYNAQLMVSAPDLLEALKNLLELKKIKEEQGKTDLYMQNQPKAWDKAKKAIDKALNGE